MLQLDDFWEIRLCGLNITSKDLTKAMADHL